MPSGWEWWYRPDRDGDDAWSAVSMARQNREGAILEAQREAGQGEGFEIMEAQSSTAQRYLSGDFDIVPFVRTRNRERFENGPADTADPARAALDQG